MEPIIAKVLLEVISDNMNLMFHKKPTPGSTVEKALRPDFENDYMCMISLANQKYQGQMVVGFPKNVADDMLKDVMQLASSKEEAALLLKASLGELLNTAAGTFAQKKPLLDTYDSLDLSTPSVYEKSEVPFFCKSEGLIGQLTYFTGEVLNCYISISPYLSLEKSDDEEDFDIGSFLDGDDLDDLLNGL